MLPVQFSRGNAPASPCCKRLRKFPVPEHNAALFHYHHLDGKFAASQCSP